jgi:hypothetical protein
LFFKQVLAADVWKFINRYREFESLPVPFSLRLVSVMFESSWSNGSADQKSLDALSTSPQAGFLNRSQRLWTLWATPSFIVWW